jgi:hypothetical protein
MRASIGKAVMHIDAPVKTIALASEVSAGNRVVRVNRSHASPDPSANGAAMPAIDTAIDVPKRERIRSPRKSSPTTNM